ncbi:MAG: aldo/keto reductase [Sciscionella sp.]
MSEVPLLTLNNDVLIPQVGFGVFLVPPDETSEAVASALELGYRHLDTARLYDNETQVGAAMATSGIPRSELFVTTKLWNADQGYDTTLRAFDASLTRLGLDYLDLYLIHWPVPAEDRYVDTWRAFERLQGDGRVRAIGVSNFHIPHLRRLLDDTSTVPAVNQIELHPWLQQRELRAFTAEHGIATEAWSPLARGGQHLEDPTLQRLALQYDVSPAQIILRWHLDLGNIVMPKSVHRERMAANLDLFSFELTDADRAAIDALDSGRRIGPDPDEFHGH